MSSTKPNIVFFFWDNFAWGELGCYGGGVLRGAPTPRIDQLAAEGQRLLNFNVEAQCTPSRSAVLTGRPSHSLRHAGCAHHGWRGRADPLGSDQRAGVVGRGLCHGMWGKWHLGSDPEQRGPVEFGFDEAVWCPRTADEVLWTMQSYFPDGPVTSAPYTGKMQIPLKPSPIFSKRRARRLR